MARQLVFTSAPQGLTPGRTGFCTVARHPDLRERLVPLIEGLSIYPPGWQPPPVICSFRLLDLGGTRFPVLSRIVDSGYDYTHRTNFLAHHLILDPEEMASAPSPADIFLRWPGWLNRWDDPPRWLADADLVNLTALPPAPYPALPAQFWERITGDAGRAALLLDDQQPAARWLRFPAGAEADILALYRESSALLPLAGAWRAEFTTCIQSSDTSAAARWSGLRAGSPPDAARPAALLDLTQPATLPPAPVATAARRARENANPLGPAARLSAAPPPKPVWAKSVSAARPGTPAPAPSSVTLPNLIGALGVLIVLGMIALIWIAFRSRHPLAPNPPLPVASAPVSILPAPVSPPNAPASDALANQQILQEIEHLADSGRFLDALARWRTLAGQAPDLASAHASFLNSRLLPGADKDWQSHFDEITTKMNAGPLDAATRKDLASQLSALADFPKNWPSPDTATLTAQLDTVTRQLALLAQLPDAPVWIIDEVSASGADQDYQDYSATLTLPALNQLFTAPTGKFRVACAPATSLALPADWYSFVLLPGDFSASDFLILHDASRGTAGGRFLQFVSDKPGEVQLRWRAFNSTGDFAQKYPANAPLCTPGPGLWLRFTADPPLSSFYILLRRPGAVSPAWSPLRLPYSWLGLSGPPAQIALPGWLAQNLPLRVSPREGFWLLPADARAATVATGNPSTEVNNPSGTHYEAGWFTSALLQENRVLQDSVAHARQHQSDLEQLAREAPVNQQPSQAAIDDAARTVEKLQADIIGNGKAIQAAAAPDWPATVAPWRLVYGPNPKLLSPLIEFSPDATGPSP